MLRIQRCLVPGSVFLAPELARVAGLSLCRMLPAGTSLHKVVPCTQSMGYIPGVWIYTECAHTAGCLYALKCVPTPKACVPLKYGTCTKCGIYFKMCIAPCGMIMYSIWRVARGVVLRPKQKHVLVGGLKSLWPKAGRETVSPHSFLSVLLRCCNIKFCPAVQGSLRSSLHGDGYTL